MNTYRNGHLTKHRVSGSEFRPEKWLSSLRKMMTWEFFRLFLVYGIPIGIVAAFVIAFLFHLDVQMDEVRLSDTEEHHLTLRENLIHQNVEYFLSNMGLLITLHSALIESHDRPEIAVDDVAAMYSAYCIEYPKVRRIRLVDKKEGFGSDFSCVNGTLAQNATYGPVIAPEESMWPFLAQLEPGDTYMSGILRPSPAQGAEAWDLAFVQFAIKPTLAQGDDLEYVIVDVGLNQIMTELTLDPGQGGTMLLVQGNGEFIGDVQSGESRSPTETTVDRHLFASHFPKIWESIRARQIGMEWAPDGLFAYSRLDLTGITAESGEYGAAEFLRIRFAPDWTIVSHVADYTLAHNRKVFLLEILLLIPAPLFVSLYLAHLALRRRQAVQHLGESDRYQRQIMDSVVDSIVTTDGKGTIERANAATAELFALQPHDLDDLTLGDLVCPDLLAPEGDIARLWNGDQGARSPAREELQLRRKDGTELPCEVVLTTANLAGERRFIWVFRDVSERAAFEAKRNAERMRFFQQAKMAEIGLIASGVIHEVGNPIAAIAGVLSQMQEREREGKGAVPGTSAELELISTQVRRLSAITREISDFVRVRPDQRELFDLNSLVRSTTRLVRYDARWKNVRLDLSLDSRISAISGIPNQIAQVLMNLLVNAADAVHDRPESERWTRVSTENCGTDVKLIVADNGCGMSDRVKQHLFEPFFTTKPEGRGTGLGLNMCATILSSHEGRIEVESNEGKGTVITVFLPVPGLADEQVLYGD